MDDRRAPAAEFVCDRCRLIPRRSGGGSGGDGRGRRRWRVHLHRLRTLRTARLAAGAVAGATRCVVVRGRGTRGACHLQQRQEHRERIERIGPRARAVLGVVAEAAEQFDQARRLQPESADVELKWGLAYVMHGRPAEALPHFERALALQPGDAEMPHALGRALLALGRRTDAIAQFEAALRLNPNHAGAHEALNLIRRSAGNPR